MAIMPALTAFAFLMCLARLTSAVEEYTVPLPQIEFLETCYGNWGASQATSQFLNWNFTRDSSNQYAVSPCAGPNITSTDDGMWDYVTCAYGTSTAVITGFEYPASKPFVLSGGIPGNLGAMTALQKLNLSHQALSGPIPSVSGLTALREIDLKSNKLTGYMPALGNARGTIQVIDVSSNNINGTIGSDICSLNQLYYLDMSSNIFYGSLPKTMLQTMTSLRHLDLGYNSFAGKINETYFENGEFTELTYLALDKNYLVGSIPSVAKLVKLERFQVDNNKLTGDIPESIWGLTRMKSLMIGHNKLQGTLSDKIGQLRSLESLHVGSSGLHGTIPHTLSYSQDTLKYIDIADNHFTGEFPSNSRILGNRSSLITAELGGNDFNAGPIPEDIFHSTMTHFDIAYSNREGTIPPKIHRMRGLMTLRMQGNSLTGPIPYQMEDLEALQFVDLANNMLTGVVDLCDLVLRSGALDALVVTGNDLNCYAECWVSESNKIIYNTDRSGDSDASTLDFCQACPAGKYSQHYYHNSSDPLAGDGYFCESCAEGKFSLVENADDPSVCQDCPISNDIFLSQAAGEACFPIVKGTENSYVGGQYYEIGSFLFATTVGLLFGLGLGVLINMKRTDSDRVHPLATFIVAMKSSFSLFAVIAELFVAVAFTLTPRFFMYGFTVILLRAGHVLIGLFIVMRTYNVTNKRKLSERTLYEDLVDQKNLLHEDNQSVYILLAMCCVLELQFVQLLPWINTDYAQSHQGWPDVMTYYGITFFKVLQSGIVSSIFMIFVTFTDDSFRGDAMLALIALYILFSAILVLYNIVVELAIINSCFSNKRGTDDLDVEEPILEGKEGATTRGTVFVDFGTGYRDSIGMSGLGLGGTDNPMARKSIGFKDIDLVTNPIARGSIFDPLGGRNSVTLDSTPAMVTGKITIPKNKHRSKKVEDPVPIAEAPTDVPDVPGSSEFPAPPRGPPPAGSPPSSSAIPSIGMPPRMPRGPPPPPGPPSKIGGPKKYTPPPRPPPR